MATLQPRQAGQFFLSLPVNQVISRLILLVPMHDLILRSVRQRIILNQEEITAFTALLTLRKGHRRQHLLEAGGVRRFMAFINQGLVRLFTSDGQGGEQVLQLALKGHWIGDLHSLLTRHPGNDYKCNTVAILDFSTPGPCILPRLAEGRPLNTPV